MGYKKLEKWFRETGYRNSLAKTVAMHVCRRKDYQKAAYQITLYNEAITCKEEHRYLGKLVDSGFRLNTHVKHLKIECIFRMNQLKCLSNVTWGGHENPQDAMSGCDQIEVRILQ